MPLSIVILAAGQGARMYSAKPKVLHELAGKPLLRHVYETAAELPERRIYIVYGHGKELLPRTFAAWDARWVRQAEQLGTGHALRQALPHISARDMVLILCGDVPLVQKASLLQLVNAARETGFSLLTAELEQPGAYGRIIRDAHNRVTAIVEAGDASAAERRIREVNTGLMAVRAEWLHGWLHALDNHNKQREYYLTDIIARAVADGVTVKPVIAESAIETLGINNRLQLAEAERHFQAGQARRLMLDGLGLADPARFDLRGELRAGRDVEIDINVIIEGRVRLGDNVRVAANCHLKDALIGDNVEILANTLIDQAVIGAGCRIGPFARLRPDTSLADNVRIGNFVEIKKTAIGPGSKASHLSYIGDAEIGKETNIGAGVITCNYDGAEKHQTIIGDHVFVGSNAQLIAPIQIADGATVAAGATLNRPVSENALAIARAEQREIPDWKRREKKTR